MHRIRDTCKVIEINNFVRLRLIWYIMHNTKSLAEVMKISLFAYTDFKLLAKSIPARFLEFKKDLELISWIQLKKIRRENIRYLSGRV